QVEPLPNLDYKLMVGDSLIETVDGQPIMPAEAAEGTQGSLGMGATEQAIAELGRLKERFFAAGPEERPGLRARIQAQEREIVLASLRERLADLETRRKALAGRGALVNWRGMQREKKELERLAVDAGRLSDLEARIRRGEAPPFFLYRLHFFPVFRDKGGFDIVIANPPYVRMELIKEQKAALAEAYPGVYHGAADLYVYFYARGLDLLRGGGMLAFISSNKFMRARYGAALRDLLGKETSLRRVIDFGDLPVFDATAYPCIVITAKAAPRRDSQPQVLPVRDAGTIGRLEDEVPRQAWAMPQARLGRGGWALERTEVLRLLDKLRAAGPPLAEVVQGRFYRGVVTGLNEAFVIDEATRARLIAEDPRSAEVIKPWLRGRDVKRWRVEWKGSYVLFACHGIDIDQYPAVRSHLMLFRERLTPGAEGGRKPGTYQWYEIQDAIAYCHEFERPKIIWPDIARRPTFGLDDQGAFADCTTFIMPCEDYYILGVLNSQALDFFFRRVASTIQHSFMRFKSLYMAQVPIPECASSERRRIEDLVRELLVQRGEGPHAQALEAEVDQRVSKLFGLSEVELRIVQDGPN
ncbi:MAG: TaqI-like C-terminal specificity domain-containing protein, partial [Anaerolineae bacterium]|nr:TaqI-like C-terminal specificity domain-containing protein [Anaerolineae bacterium]